MRTEEPRPIHLSEYRPPTYLVDEVHLTVRLHRSDCTVDSVLSMRPNPDGGGGDLVLAGEDMTLRTVVLDGAALGPDNYTVASDALTIPAARLPDAPFKLEIATTLAPEKNTALEGLYLSNGTYCTQCEAEGFRKITYYPDRPDVLARFTTRIVGDATGTPVLLSNGNLIASGTTDDGRPWAEWHDPFPKPSYLFALVAGDLAPVEDCFITASGREVALRIYVEHGNEARCGYAMDALKRSMRWDEVRYGREYDLDVFMIVAVSDFNMGAMENKGLNVFNAKYILADPDTANDHDYALIESIIAHEYFHNWTGNRITCRDWFQLCLKEGLTVFRDQQFSADERSAAVERISQVQNLRVRQFAEDSGPLAHPVRPASYIEINNFYTATVYEKGAEVVRMLHTLLGEEAYRRGMDLYFDRHDGEAVTIEQFVACFAEASGRDLSQFMLWYTQAGTPHLTARGEHDRAARTYTLSMRQETKPTPGQGDKQPVVLPIRYGLVAPDGSAVPLKLTPDETGAPAERMLEMSGETAEIIIHDVAEPPIPSLLRGFSAPARLDAGLGEADDLFLMGADPDPFNRWDASQRTMLRILLARYRDPDGDIAAPIGDDLAAAIDRTLNDQSLDPAFKARMIDLPPLSVLIHEVRDADPPRLHAVRQAVLDGVGMALAPTFERLYETHRLDDPARVDPQAANHRALRYRAMQYLARRPLPGAIDIAIRHFEHAPTMTDTMAALQALVLCGGEPAARALAQFYERFKADPLVIDKWLSVQATTVRNDIVEEIGRLRAHEAFSIRNPNKVRALIGAFAHGNLACFHAADGRGYTLVADWVSELDPLNPQVASRLLSAFEGMRLVDPARRERMKTAVSRVLEGNDVSRDVREIGTKILATA